ncbi:MAG: hypothetical protein RLZZ90_595 [Actinomycetota bacterium]
MSIRKFAAIGIAASLLLGTTGCSLFSPVATRASYSPGDGTQIDLETIKVRNFMYLSDGKGGEALFGSIINPSLESKSIKIQYTDGTLKEKKEVAINLLAGQKIDLGYNGGSALAIDLDGEPGGVVEVFIIEGSNTGKRIEVPVLDGTLEQYKDLVDALKAPAATN